MNEGINATLNGSSVEEHLRYLQLQLQGGVFSDGGAYKPGRNALYDLGSDEKRLRTLFMQNNGGRVLDLTNADVLGVPSIYTFWLGGGGSQGSSEALFKFQDMVGGTNTDNAFIIEFGAVDFANAVHRYIFQSTGNGAFLGDISVETEFGGALGPRAIGISFVSTGTFQYYNNINCKMGTPLGAGYAPRTGNNTWKRFELQFDDNAEYKINNGNAWHRFQMGTPAMAFPSTYGTAEVAGPNDTLTANAVARFTLQALHPSTVVGGNTLDYACAIRILGNPSVGTANTAIFMGQGASMTFSGTNSGLGPRLSGIIFAGDLFLVNASSTNSAIWQLLLPSGTSELARLRLYNNPGFFSNSILDVDVDAAICNILVKEQAAITPITTMNIGSDASSTMALLNLRIANAIIAGITADSLFFNERLDANHILVVGVAYTAAAVHVILCDDDAAGAIQTITLPPAATSNAIYEIKKLGTTANVIIDGDAGELIDGALTLTLLIQYTSVTLYSDGTGWHIL